MDGGWLSKKTCCTLLVPWCSGLIEPASGAASESSAEMVKSVGAEPSEVAERGKVKLKLPPAAAVPGCAHAPLSPASRMQTVAGSTPAASAMVAVTVSGPPAPL